MKDICYVPSLWCNLLSINQILKKGYTIGNDGEIINVSRGKIKIKFDEIIKTGDGHVNAVKIEQIQEMANSSIGINIFHKLLGHPNKETVKRTAAYYDQDIHGEFKPCEDCELAKIKQKKVNKVASNHATRIGERIAVDISYMMTKSIGGSSYWILCVDEWSKKKWSFFVKHKSELADTVVGLIKNYMRMERFRKWKCFMSDATMRARIKH